MSRKKILVTGATGNVGRYVCQYLDEAKIPFLAATTTSRRTNNKNDCCSYKYGEYVTFDFTDPKTFTFQDFDTVFLMRPPHISNIQRDMTPALEWFQQDTIGVKYIVVMSLLGCENMSYIPHRKLELAIQKMNFQYTFLRPGFFMQNLSGIHAKEIQTMNEILIPAGPKTNFSFIDAQDIAYAATTCLQYPKQHQDKCYNITGKEALNYYEIAKKLSKVTKKEIVYNNPSISRFIYTMRQRNLSWEYILVMVGLYTASRFGHPDIISSAFKEITGRDPISFEEFAQREADAWI